MRLRLAENAGFHWLLFSLFVLGIISTGTAVQATPTDSEPVRVPSGAARATTASDLAPHPQAGTRTYNELWSYLFYFDDGSQAALNFSRADLGSRDPICGADLTVLGFNGQNYRVARQYGLRSRWNYDASAAKLNVHPTIYFEGAPPRRHRVHFVTTKDDVSYRFEMTFSAMLPGQTWGDGVFQLGRERLGVFVHIPFARVSGVIEINGVRRQVTGTAYMDQTFQTTYGPRVARGAFRYVSHRGSQVEVGYLIRPAARFEERPLGFALRTGAGGLQLRKPSTMQIVSTTTERGAQVPRQLSVQFEDGQQVITKEQTRYAVSALEELSALERPVVRSLLGGELVYVHGRGSLGGGGAMRYLYTVVR